MGIPFIFYDGSKISKRLYFHNFPEYSELFSFDLAQLEIKFFQYILQKRSENKKNKLQPSYAFYKHRTL